MCPSSNQHGKHRIWFLRIGNSVISTIIFIVFAMSAAYADSWIPLGTGMNGQVSAIAFDGSGNPYAGGAFTLAGSVNANNVAKWDGNSWRALGAGTNGTVYVLACDGSGNLYAGGSFTMAGGSAAVYVAKWDGNAWSALGAGLNVVFHGFVRALAFDSSGNLYAGGSFTTAGGATNIAKWDGNSWNALGTWIESSPIAGMTFDQSGNLYAGGKNIGKWNGNSWSVIETGMDTTIYSLAFDKSGNLYADGDYSASGSSMAMRYFAKWNGISWSYPNLGSPDGSYATDLVFDLSGNLYLGNGDYLVKWDGNTYTKTQLGMVLAVAIDPSGSIHAGGKFEDCDYTGINCVSGGYVKKLSADIPGDLNSNGKNDLADAILALKILAGIPIGNINLKADVNGDGKIGMEEVIHIMQKVSNVRN